MGFTKRARSVKNRFSGQVGKFPQDSIRELQKTRRYERSDQIAFSIGGGIVGGAAGFSFHILKNPAYGKGDIVLGMATGLVTAGGIATLASKRANSAIRNANLNVEKTLSHEAKTNTNLREFLKNFKYVLIDRKGRIIGTNKERLFGLGRMRMETSKMLEKA